MKRIAVAIAALSMVAISSVGYAKENPSPTITELMNMHHDKSAGNEPIGDDAISEKNFNLKTMYDSAIQLGIYSGYNHEMKRLYASIKEIKTSLDMEFDFGVLMRSTNTGKFEALLLPGVVVETKENLTISPDGKQAEHTKSRIEIIAHERFVSEAPNWRNYLLMDDFKEYQPPFNSILPKTSEEQEVWREGIKKGWELGTEQANEEVIANARALGRDFIGMSKFIRYSLSNHVEMPALAFETSLVKSDGNVMNISVTNYQLTSPARLNSKTGEWEILKLSTRQSLRKDGEF